MKIISPSYSVITSINRHGVLSAIESFARVCYKSECKITKDSAPEFVRKLVKVKKHESVIEHSSISVRFIVDRGVSHEIVRHRLAAFSQESTRYVSYSDDRFGNQITVIRPCFWSPDDPKTKDAYARWERGCLDAEAAYMDLINGGATPQQARSVLPNSTKTELVMTANLREWRHVLALRTSEAAHPQMREVMVPLRAELVRELPEIFE